MSWQPSLDPAPGDARACDAVEQVIVPRARDLGGFDVRRALPAAGKQMVSPFIFFDQMGPAEFLVGSGLDVRPHPPIGLATVTYLFDGELMHRDSLGAARAIRPGELNQGRLEGRPLSPRPRRFAGVHPPARKVVMMTAQGFALFHTAVGPCGLAWSERGVAGVQLPERDEQATRARMRLRFPKAREGEPPPAARRARDAIVALLAGEPRDLSAIALDMEGVPAFHRRVYEAARDIPRGATLSYGDVARRVGASGAARAVGQALARNPFAVIVPCHRVLSAGGRIGGFSANEGVETKRRLLAIEGAGELV